MSPALKKQPQMSGHVPAERDPEAIATAIQVVVAWLIAFVCVATLALVS